MSDDQPDYKPDTMITHDNAARVGMTLYEHCRELNLCPVSRMAVLAYALGFAVAASADNRAERIQKMEAACGVVGEIAAIYGTDLDVADLCGRQ